MSAKKLAEHFSELKDPRCSGKVEHLPIDILVIAVCAVIAGAESWVDMALYGQNKADWLSTFLRLPNGIPAHDTFRRVFMLIDPEASLIARHGVLDHNQQSLLGARSVHYRPCPDGLVAVYFSGMSSFIMQAAEEQGFRGRIIVQEDTTSTCSKGRYVELRALVRGETNVDALLRHAMKWESAPDALRPIISVDLTSPANQMTEKVKALVAIGKRMDFAYYAIPMGGLLTKYVLEDGHAALLYTDKKTCLPRAATIIAAPRSDVIWAEVAAKHVQRSIAVCAMQSGAWLPAEMPQFLQAAQ